MNERRRLEGAGAVREAFAAAAPVRLVLVRSGAEDPDLFAAAESAGVPVRGASDSVFRRFARSGDCDVLALVGPAPRASLDELMRRPGAVWLLAGAAYPGNVGFAVRTAEVSGAAGIVVDAPFGGGERRRALRAAMDAQRFFPVLWHDAVAAVEVAVGANRRVVAIEDRGVAAPWDTELTGDLLLVVGGERDGIPAPVLERADAVVRLPMRGFVPSYNLQAAMSAVAFERLRQEA